MGSDLKSFPCEIFFYNLGSSAPEWRPDRLSDSRSKMQSKLKPAVRAKGGSSFGGGGYRCVLKGAA